jgi:RHH-type proline utilization regulon transcriptional repressor/proline dehydrogenase/delta 1-pyrroline-5-carboxylate dehydrogenase
VFTRKEHTDISFIACSRKLLDMRPHLYPQFATHNAHTMAAVLEMAGTDYSSFEFQRLHGMGETLHEVVRAKTGARCRIYAPVGTQEDLLAYLVRRLLENGANSSFVHQIVDTSVPAAAIVQDPFAAAHHHGLTPHGGIKAPANFFGPDRQNSTGWDLGVTTERQKIEAMRSPFAAPHTWQFGTSGTMQANPAKLDEPVGSIDNSTAEDVGAAIVRAQSALAAWSSQSPSARQQILLAAADLYERNSGEIYALLCREAGKTLPDAIGEVREAVDFLRYYGQQAHSLPANAVPRGVIACISPWNFPLAIFTGQISAALAAGNTVVAKPAEQSPLIAQLAVNLLWQAGAPKEALNLVIGDGPAIGASLVASPDIGGVCFTGSTAVAKTIERQLAKSAPTAMLIAETGGINAMIVDSTALAEQAVTDIIASAFQSAGQRCSALRMLYVQADIVPTLMPMLREAMDCLTMGSPWKFDSDVGPVIDAEAEDSINSYREECRARGRILAALDSVEDNGRYIPPTLIEVAGIEELDEEIFGPILHVATYASDELPDVVEAINQRGYGLTFGVHTRIDSRVQYLLDHVNVGNIYVNRNQIGAVVGAQPFGGEGLSGTGPKAGGPLYLPRFTRNPDDQTGPLSGDGAAPQVTKDQLTAAVSTIDPSSWLGEANRIERLRQALRGRASSAMAAAAAVDIGPLDLPGPTGESNQYRLLPLGLVLCLGPDPETLIGQVVQALRMGNQVLAIGAQAADILTVLNVPQLPLAALQGTLDPRDLSAISPDGIAWAGNAAYGQALRLAAAELPGSIVRMIDERINPSRYAMERSICVDTTAAGGNASLLAETG